MAQVVRQRFGRLAADARIEEQSWLLILPHGTVHVGLCWWRYCDIVDCVGDGLIVLVALEE